MILISAWLGKSTRARLARLATYEWTIEGIIDSFYAEYIALACILIECPEWPCYFESFDDAPIQRRIHLSDVVEPRRQRRKTLGGWVKPKRLARESNYFELFLPEDSLEALLVAGVSKDYALRILQNGIHFCILAAELLQGDGCVLTAFDNAQKERLPSRWQPNRTKAVQSNLDGLSR